MSEIEEKLSKIIDLLENSFRGFFSNRSLGDLLNETIESNRKLQESIEDLNTKLDRHNSNT